MCSMYLKEEKTSEDISIEKNLAHMIKVYSRNEAADRLDFMGATTITTTTALHLTVQVLDLSPKVTKDDLIVFFSYCGTVDSIHLQSEGKDQPQLAFVTFRQPFAYQTALLLNGVFLAGHPVRVLALQGSPTPPNLYNMNNLTPSKETQGQRLIPIMQAAVQSMASKGVGILNKTKTELEENCKLAEKGRSVVNQTRSAIGTMITNNRHLTNGAVWVSDALDKASKCAFELTTREKRYNIPLQRNRNEPPGHHS